MDFLGDRTRGRGTAYRCNFVFCLPWAHVGEVGLENIMVKQVEDYVEPTQEDIDRVAKIIADAKEISAYNPFLKWPRNRPCPCNSGKKFKVCCLDTIPKKIPLKNAALIMDGMKKAGIVL